MSLTISDHTHFIEKNRVKSRVEKKVDKKNDSAYKKFF